MEIGTRPEMDIPDSKFISRPEIAKYFEKIFQPGEDQSNYHIIYGNKGNGKTTLAKKMANEVGQGVIYVDTPYNIENFEKSFGSIHDFTFKEDSSFLFQLIQKFFDKAGVNKIDKLKRALNAFTKAAKIYKEQYDNPPVIIYDNIDNIDPKILEILQDDAEYNANNGTYIAVFICGGEKFTQILQSSRKSHIFEVEDLNKDESVNFLIQKLKISPEDADKIYGLVGGNIRELKFVAERLKNGELLEDIKENILLEVEKKFDIAKLDLTQEGRSIIGTLLKSKEVGYLEFKKVFGKVEGFNGMNIFTYHHKARSVTFQSRPIELYIKKLEMKPHDFYL
ncbi:P-loop containing nucleoside triphosphate hydrolase protein [Rhizophagus irregularis DAOM 181602=DAOM 197198]|nr:P-loop containing nucleoside triphosphate hydrolase protein [Rhizophagus irregularis DAOM 181602=DAOM 197198]